MRRKNGAVLIKGLFGLLLCSVLLCSVTQGQVTRHEGFTVVKPRESDAVFNNPGIGFTTFQRFNGDQLNAGLTWTEGMPIDYQPTPSTVRASGYPSTSVAYLRLYWRFLEVGPGKYEWSVLDKAFETAASRGQTLMLRIAPHGVKDEEDVPAWYREEIGVPLDKHRPAPNWLSSKAKWMVDPENPAFAREFGTMIRAIGARYDGDPRLELVDISILGAWGEGAGSDLLSATTKKALVDSYMESFHKTPLAVQPFDPQTTMDVMARARNAGASNDPSAPLVGWRADCFGDMGGFDPNFGAMLDMYPQAIVRAKVQDLWKQAPVSLEACWVMQTWKDKGWSLAYIMDQAIKWHVSTFNAKSSAVPEAWWPTVNEWLKHMGYRFALRRFAYTPEVDASRRLGFESWWENKGNAPIYRLFPVALRISSGNGQWVVPLDGDPRTWLPGDSLMDGGVFLPDTIPDGTYKLDIAMVDPVLRTPKVKLAIEGTGDDGWYPLGGLQVRASLR